MLDIPIPYRLLTSILCTLSKSTFFPYPNSQVTNLHSQVDNPNNFHKFECIFRQKKNTLILPNFIVSIIGLINRYFVKISYFPKYNSLNFAGQYAYLLNFAGNYRIRNSVAISCCPENPCFPHSNSSHLAHIYFLIYSASY